MSLFNNINLSPKAQQIAVLQEKINRYNREMYLLPEDQQKQALEEIEIAKKKIHELSNSRGGSKKRKTGTKKRAARKGKRKSNRNKK